MPCHVAHSLCILAHVATGATQHLPRPRHAGPAYPRPNVGALTVPPFHIRHAVAHAVHRARCERTWHASTRVRCAPCAVVVAGVSRHSSDRLLWTQGYRRVRRLVLARDRMQCQIRGPKCTGYATQVDHVIPRAEGGSIYDMANLRASCGPCNWGRHGGVGRRRRGVGSQPFYETRL
jgi:5-methylcytosine-specific restriction endonuclease McrA